MTDATRMTILRPDDLVAGKYRIHRKLAEGGMGSVYHAIQEPLGRDVALKTLKDVGDNAKKREERYKRFFREASYSSKLNHPNTVTIFDYGKLPDEGGFYLVMEFLKGKSLRELMREKGGVSVAVTLHIATQIASSLSEAHEMGVIHRDLKPPNVMLVHRSDDPYFVKVVDFGLVKELEPESDDEELTAENALIGSPRYMAPERFLYHSADSPSVDVYALGIMLYEMLVGRPPFIRSPESTLQHIMMQHVQDEPPAMGKFAPDLRLPEGLETLIMRCLAKEPGDRPTMAGLCRLLKACADGATTIEDELRELPTIEDARPVHPDSSGDYVTGDTGHGERPVTDDATRPDLPSVQPSPESTGPLPAKKEVDPRNKIGVAIALFLPLFAAGLVIFLAQGPDPTRLHVTSEPPGAYVYADGRQLGQTPFDIEMVVERTTTLRFTRDDHADTKVVLNPGLGETFDVAVDLEPTNPVGAGRGETDMKAEPNDDVRTGEVVGDAPDKATKRVANADAGSDDDEGLDLEQAEEARAIEKGIVDQKRRETELKSIKKKLKRNDPGLDIKMDR